MNILTSAVSHWQLAVLSCSLFSHFAKFIYNWRQYALSFGFWETFIFAITWLKIIQTLQVGGVLEFSEPPFDDGFRDF